MEPQQPQEPKRRRGRPPRGVDPFGEGRGRGRVGHFKVEDILRDEDRDAYNALLRQHKTTHKSAWRWLRERGYKIGLTAVRNHRCDFKQRLAAVNTAAEMSYACGELARQTGTPVMADGAVARFETLLSQIGRAHV